MEAIHVVEVVESAAYGTGKHVVELCRGLAEGGFQVTLIASTRRDRTFREKMAELEKTGVNCIEVEMSRGISPVRDTRALLSLRRLLKKLRPDVVHGHGSKSGFLARAAAHSLGIMNTVYTPHCFAFGVGKAGMRERLYRRLERWAGRWTARLVAVSRHEKDFAIAQGILPGERIILVPNGLGDAEMERCEPPAGLAGQFGLAKNDRVLCFVGRLWRQKGLDVLIRAFAKVIEKEPQCRLLLVGEGPEEESLRTLARDCGLSQQVVFAGNRDDARCVMGLAQVFVLPSRWESAPYALLEAMASGVPIVATRVGGVAEMLDEGRCGRLVAPDSPDELAQAILTALTQPAQSAAMAEAARERVRKLYRLSDSITQTANIYRELADRKP